jgi:hypothetical protein
MFRVSEHAESVNNQPVEPKIRLPELVISADWSTSPKKRRAVRAVRTAGGYVIEPPEPVGDVATFLAEANRSAGENGTCLVGFDFPIGLPSRYAAAVGFGTFRDALRRLGHDEWAAFFKPSDEPELRRPFFPANGAKVGRGAKGRLVKALGADYWSDLLRKCEITESGSALAECLFWLVGPRQVGRAAAHAWQAILQPAMDVARLWPFDGPLDILLGEPGVVIAEIYPADAYAPLNVRFPRGTGKLDRDARRAALATCLAVLDEPASRFKPAALEQIARGFDSDDDFDAMIGLLAMLSVLEAPRRNQNLPQAARTVEGWMLTKLLDVDVSHSTDDKAPPEGRSRSKSDVRIADDFRDNLIIDRYDPVFLPMRASKIRHLRSENSEDALTWNVFRSLLQISPQFWLKDLVRRGLRGASLPDDDVRITLWSSVAPPASLLASGAEGHSEIDVILESSDWVWFIEAKYKSDISPRTTVRSGRDQVIRNIDVGSQYAGDRDFYFSLLVLDAEYSPVGAERISQYTSLDSVREALAGHRTDGLVNLRAVTLLTWSQLAAVLSVAAHGAARLDERGYAERALAWLGAKGVVPDAAGDPDPS